MLTVSDCCMNKCGLKIRPFLDFCGNSSKMNILMSHGGGFDAMRHPAFTSQGFRYTSPLEWIHQVRVNCMNLFLSAFKAGMPESLAMQTTHQPSAGSSLNDACLPGGCLKTCPFTNLGTLSGWKTSLRDATRFCFNGSEVVLKPETQS